MSLGSSFRVPKYLKGPITRPDNRRAATARYVPSGERLDRRRMSSRSDRVIWRDLPDGTSLIWTLIGNRQVVGTQCDDEVLDLPVTQASRRSCWPRGRRRIWPRGSRADRSSRTRSLRSESVAVKPGEKPADFARVIVHLPVAGGAPSIGPRTASSIEIGRVPMRLVNQLESGTSSTVFTLPARTFASGSPGRVNRLSIRSTKRSTSCGAVFDAS